MADTVYSLEELSAQPAAKPKATGKVIPLASLGEVATAKPVSKDPTPFSRFVDKSVDAVKRAGSVINEDPSAAIEGGFNAAVKGIASIAQLAVSGVGALAKTIYTRDNVDGFVKTKEAIDKHINLINQAPADKQEEAMQNLLGIIPSAVEAVGDTVYDKTGSALAGAGAQALTTLLTFNPEIAGKVMKGAGEWTKGKPDSKLGGAFDELAATDSEAATKVANHVNQVDPVTAKVLHKRIQKYIDASEEELNLIGKNAADAAIEEISGDYEKVRAKANLPGYLGSGAERGMGSGESGTSKRSRVQAGASGMLDAETDPGLGVGEGKGGRIKTQRMAADRPTFSHFDNIDEGMFDKYADYDAKGGSVRSKQLLEQMLEHAKSPTETGSLQRQLLSRLHRLVPNIEIHFTDDLVDSQGERFDDAAGIYDGHANNIKVSLAKGADTRAILHELTHAATTRFIYFNPDHPLVMELEKLRLTAKSVFNKSGETYSINSHYGLTDVHEFVAEAMTSRQFQQFLGRVKLLNKETLMSRFVDTVKKVLGYKPGDNTRFLERVIRTSEDLMEEAGEARRQGKTIPGRRPVETAPIKVNPEQASSTIRETVKQALGTIEEASKDSTKAGEDNVLYFNNGIPVTRQAIEGAFKAVGEGLRAIPGMKIAEGKLEGLYSTFIEHFNPEAKGPQAREAGAAIARNFFVKAAKENEVWEQGKTRREYWLKMGEQAGIDFINGMERGVKFKNETWNKAQAHYTQWAAKIYRQDMETWAKAGRDAPYDPLDHYVPHMFEDTRGVAKWMKLPENARKWGDPRFIKERGFDLYTEALKHGFTPKFKNPEELMQARQIASDTAKFRSELLMDLRQRGLAKEAKPGEELAPHGYHTNSYRAPTGQRYWVNEELGPLMYNVFDSKSLWENQRLPGQTYRGFMELKNKVIPLKLAASLFHPMHVLHIDAAAELTAATKEMLAGQGNVLKRTGDFMLKLATTFPYSPGSWYKSGWKNWRAGEPLLRVFQGKLPFDKLSDSDKEAWATLAESGLIPTRPREEMTNDIQRWNDALVKRSVTAVWHAPWAALAFMSKWTFGTWIPSLKIAAVLRDAKAIRETNPGMSAKDRQIALRDAARKVEARYGEMNRNSQFINKLFQDTMIATNLSWGWNAGLLDQYVGGTIDLARGVAGKGSIKSGQFDRPIMAAYYITSALVLGGLITKLLGGQDPQSLIDYTHPLSGDKDKYGKPVRLNTMWYTREFEGLYKHMQQEGVVPGLEEFVLNKGSGIFEMAKTGLNGVNTLGEEIMDPNAPLHKRIEQTLLYEFADINPIAIEAINRSTGNRYKAAAEAVIGFTPAGRYISQTVTEGKIENAYNKFVRPTEKPFEAVQRSKDFGHLAQLYEKGGPAYDQALDQAIKAYQMTPKDVGKLERSFRKEDSYDPSLAMFKRLDWTTQKTILDHMTPTEREKYLPVSNKEHLRRHYEATP